MMLSALLAFLLTGSETPLSTVGVVHALAGLAALLSRVARGESFEEGNKAHLAALAARAVTAIERLCIAELAGTNRAEEQLLRAVTPSQVRRVLHAVIVAEHRAVKEALEADSLGALPLEERWGEGALRGLAEDLAEDLASIANEGPDGPALPPRVELHAGAQGPRFAAWDAAARLLLVLPATGERDLSAALRERVRTDPAFVSTFLDACDIAARGLAANDPVGGAARLFGHALASERHNEDPAVAGQISAEEQDEWSARVCTLIDEEGAAFDDWITVCRSSLIEIEAAQPAKDEK